ncbi:MAG: dUTP diphosphatase [archaeon]
MINVKIKLKEGCEDIGLPKYETKGSAAADLRAAIDTNVRVISPGDSALILTGLFVEIPESYMMHITPRSGFAAKYGIGIVNSPGIIDSDYRGEVGVILVNHGHRDFEIHRGDRIAQMSFVKVEQANFETTENISKTERGEGGFGSTGHK